MNRTCKVVLIIVVLVAAAVAAVILFHGHDYVWKCATTLPFFRRAGVLSLGLGALDVDRRHRCRCGRGPVACW